MPQLARDLIVAIAFALAATAATFSSKAVFGFIFASYALSRIPFFFQTIFIGNPQGMELGLAVGVFFEWFFVGLVIAALLGLLRKRRPEAR